MELLHHLEIGYEDAELGGGAQLETAAVIQVLALMSLVRPLSRTTSSLFLSLGFPQYNLLTALTQAVCMTLFILPALRWGIVGVASAVAFAVVVGLVQNMYLVCKKTGLPFKFQDIERSVRPILWSGFLMCLSLVAIKVMLYYYSVNTYNLSFLFICGVIGVLIYISAVYVFERRVVVEIVKLVRQSVTGEPTSFKILP